MAYLWYSNSTSVTGIALAEKLGLDSGISPPPLDTDLVISWGARLPKDISYDMRERLRELSYINNVFAIEKNANKYNTLKKLKDVCSVPKVFSIEEIREKLYNKELLDGILIGRKYHHRSGSDFYMCLQHEDIENCLDNVDYFIQFIPCRAEYRVHIFQDKVIRVSKKVPKEDEHSKWIRSFEKGWKFIDLKSYIYLNPLVIEESKKAVSSLGLDFGGVDVILSDNRKAYVLEVNTGMGLMEKSLELYTQIFKEKLEKQKGGWFKWF